MARKSLTNKLVGVMCALTCVLALTACSAASTAQEKARQAVEAEFSKISSLDESTLSEMLASAGSDSLQSLTSAGIDPLSFMKSYFGGFTYKIGDVTVDEDAGTGTVKVTVSCKSLQSIAGDMSSTFQEKLSELGQDGLTEDKVKSVFGDALSDAVDAASNRDVEVDIPVEKSSDGSWVISDAADDQVFSMIMQ